LQRFAQKLMRALRERADPPSDQSDAVYGRDQEAAPRPRMMTVEPLWWRSARIRRPRSRPRRLSDSTRSRRPHHRSRYGPVFRLVRSTSCATRRGAGNPAERATLDPADPRVNGRREGSLRDWKFSDTGPAFAGQRASICRGVPEFRPARRQRAGGASPSPPNWSAPTGGGIDLVEGTIGAPSDRIHDRRWWTALFPQRGARARNPRCHSGAMRNASNPEPRKYLPRDLRLPRRRVALRCAIAHRGRRGGSWPTDTALRTLPIRAGAG